MAELTTNEQFADALLRHQTFLLRIGGEVRRRGLELINKTESLIADIIIAGLKGRTGLRTPADVKRLKKIEKRILRVRTDGWKKVEELLKAETTQVAFQEPEFIQSITATVLPVTIVTKLPRKSTLRAITKQSMQGRTIAQWMRSLRAADIQRINATVEAGMVEGAAATTIARRVIGSSRVRGINGVTQVARVGFSAITQTAVQHVANRSRREFFLDNESAFVKEKFVATLDSLTTPICIDTDGSIFPIESGRFPPLHVGCRSIRIPWFDSVVLGDRPMTAFTEKRLLTEYAKKVGLTAVPISRAGLPFGFKTNFDTFRRGRIKQLIGTVPQSVDYQEFLTRQPIVFQEDVLGVAKTKLFRTGKITVHQFVAPDGRPLRLSELAAKHSDVFKAAGLNPNNF